MGLLENKKLYDKLSKEIKAPAIAMLKKELPMMTQEEIRACIKDDPIQWVIPYHMDWGMAIRNLLRDKDFGEEHFKVGNLDDIYAELVEEAVKE